MPAATSGTKTVTRDVASHLPGSLLTTLLAKPVENMTVGEFHKVADALKRIPKGGAEDSIIGTLFV